MTRSNRQLTQFAVRKVEEFIRFGPDGFQDEAQGNTEVKIEHSSLQVRLFGEVIFSIGNSQVTLFGGNFYDSIGRPSRTTRERLNGLLDSLGQLHFIPEGTRAFIDKETGQCRVGSGDKTRNFDETTKPISIISNPNSLVFS
jgi:hypothetical protein